MRFENPLVFVTDVAVSTAFYSAILELPIVERHDDFVLFEHGFAIHHGGSLLDAAGIDEPARGGPWGRNNLVLYFHTDEPHELFERVRTRCSIVHPPRTEHWGETIFRVRDPDGHILEIGDGART